MKRKERWIGDEAKKRDRKDEDRKLVFSVYYQYQSAVTSPKRTWMPELFFRSLFC